MPKVLFVDDEPSIRLTASEFLRRAGYEVESAADYDGAISLASVSEFDAAVVDVNLPGGKSGLDLLRELNAREPYIPVVIITGEPNLSLLPEVVRSGAYDFIAKPVVKDVLLKAVARAVEKKRLVVEKQRLEAEIRLYAETLERRVEERTQELVEVYRVLAQQEKTAALGRVAAQVAHEVKNPLAGLLLYSMHLRSKTEGKLAPNEAELLDKIIATINHLSGTCEQVLSFARPVHIEPRPADLNRIVLDVLQLAEPQLGSGGVRTNLELAGGGVVVPLDESSLRATLMNLVLNAVQAMRGGGELRVATGTSADSAWIEVADTGCGMTQEQARSVFEPFYTTKPSGLGLGMPYAKRVVERHGGTVHIESQPGEGTRVRVTLPLEVGA